MGDGINAVSAEAIVKDDKLILFAINKTTKLASFHVNMDGADQLLPVIHQVLTFKTIDGLKRFAMDEPVLAKIETPNRKIILPPLSINRIDVEAVHPATK